MNTIKSIALALCIIAFPISAETKRKETKTSHTSWAKRGLVALGALALVKSGSVVYANTPAQPSPAEICVAINNGGALPLNSRLHLNVAQRDCSQYAHQIYPTVPSEGTSSFESDYVL